MWNFSTNGEIIGAVEAFYALAITLVMLPIAIIYVASVAGGIPKEQLEDPDCEFTQRFKPILENHKVDTLHHRLYYAVWYVRRLIMIVLAFTIKSVNLGFIQIQIILLFNLVWAWFLK